jgi:adenine-specific DNA-methyltransferase
MDPRGPVTYRRARPLRQGETRPRDQDKDPQIVWNGVKLTLTPAQLRELIEREKAGKPATIEIGDAQLVWRGKDEQDWSDLVVNAPPLYIQEKIHPKAIIDDLVRQSRKKAEADSDAPSLFGDLFADFNGLKDPEARTEFYQHSQHWSNRMILGDSLAVMASLAEREALRGQVQCIYFDPPYGIKFNSNWQVSTQSRDVKDGKQSDISREPEQVKAFRDTWVDGIHSYLTYLRDRLTVARDLLTESGSIFVQISDENLHRVRALLDEVFGDQAFVVTIPVKKKGNQKSSLLDPVNDYLIWYCRNDRGQAKFRPLYEPRSLDDETLRRFNRVALPDGRELLLEEVPAPAGVFGQVNYRETPARLVKDWPGARLFYPGEQLTSGGIRPNQSDPVEWEGATYRLNAGLCWKTTTRTSDGSTPGMRRLQSARRLVGGNGHLNYKRFLDDFGRTQISNWWDNLGGAPNAIYVVQTTEEIVKRCILMTTDPGDLVLDPTCGSGTTAVVAEQWARRWITIDTSRVALALARTRLMSARFPYYHLADSKGGREQEQSVSGKVQPDTPVNGDIRQGFVYDRAPHVTLGLIANNAEIDTIWEAAQTTLEPLRAALNTALGKSWEEWEIPSAADDKWPEAVKQIHAQWREARIERQRRIDDSIKEAADIEYLYDRPYVDTSKVRVTGPFTVESLSPHRVVPSGHDEMADELKAMAGKRRRARLATPPPISPPWCSST